MHISFCMAHWPGSASRRRLHASMTALEYQFGCLELDSRPLLEVFFLVKRINDMAVVSLRWLTRVNPKRQNPTNHAGKLYLSNQRDAVST